MNQESLPTQTNVFKPGQKVDLVILRETDLGFVAQVNETHEGLLYHNQIFETLQLGQKLQGYINRLREDGRIDLLLQPFGNYGADDLGQKILHSLKLAGGFLPVNADSPAEKVYDFFGVSKKKFKIAIGGLYKKRLIRIIPDGIDLI